MWQLEWGSSPDALDGPGGPQASLVQPEDVAGLHVLYWEEHCLECAPPTCFTSCSLFVERGDKRCARFQYGIWANTDYPGPFGFGADLSFRRWAKLEARLNTGVSSLQEQARLTRLDRGLGRGLGGVANTLLSLSPNRKLVRGYAVGRAHALRKIYKKPSAAEPYDGLLIEAWNPGDSPFNLAVETKGEGQRFRSSLPMRPGHNIHLIPYDALNLDLEHPTGRLMIYPEADAEVRVIFSWLDLVRFREGYRPPVDLPAPAPANAGPAERVKCVAWDLDNTFWEGILIEDGPEGVQPRAQALQLVKDLDERGVLQTIASKNDYEVAWPVIEGLGLADYFLYPAIHWGAKSSSLKQVAAELNIGIDTFAFIDDSVFEREEVGAALPQVRVYEETVLDGLLDLPEFDIEVSAESSARRLSYLAEAQRKRISQGYGDEYEHFLRDCAMEARIFVPRDEAHVTRCLELLQRSNQLNLSTYRYQRHELDEALASEASLCIALAVKDRFGDYGTVGFARIDTEGDQAVLRDWVASCRVAKKKVENAWFQWLVELLRRRGHGRLHARFIPTDRNGVLRSILDEVGFAEVGLEDENVLLDLELSADVPHSDIVAVAAEEIE